jgi:hypothetical protein
MSHAEYMDLAGRARRRAALQKGHARELNILAAYWCIGKARWVRLVMGG